MNWIIIKIKEYFRCNNVKKWLPIISSLVGMLIGPILSMVFERYSRIYLFATAFCVLFFIFYSALYIDRWHSIIIFLRDYEQPLYNSCVFLAGLDKSRKMNRINQSVRVSSVTIDYLFCDEAYYEKQGAKEDDEERLRFPFETRYHIKGIVEQEFDNLYHHIVMQKPGSVSISVTSDEPDLTGSAKDEGINGNLRIIKLLFTRRLKKGDLINYNISIPFEKERGLTTKPGQRLLFYPENISRLFIDNAQIEFNLFFPKSLHSKYISKYFETFSISRNPRFLEETNISEKAFSRIDKNDMIVYHRKFPLKRSDNTTLYCIEVRTK